MTAPTEEEIRAASGVFDPDDVIARPGHALYDAILHVVGDPFATLYDDLRPSESQVSDRLWDGIVEEATRRTVATIEALTVEAVRAFAVAHPDAPRAEREAAPA